MEYEWQTKGYRRKKKKTNKTEEPRPRFTLPPNDIQIPATLSDKLTLLTEVPQIDGVEYFIRADPLVRHFLKMTLTGELVLNEKSAGTGQTLVDWLDEPPVVKKAIGFGQKITFDFVRINGISVCFYNSEENVIDWRIIEMWLGCFFSAPRIKATQFSNFMDFMQARQDIERTAQGTTFEF